MRKSLRVLVAETNQRARSNTHRIEELETKYDKLDGRQDSTEKTIIGIKKDTEKILALSKESSDRWKEFDKIQKEKSDVIKIEIMKWIIRIIAGIVIIALGIKKFIL